MIDAAALPVRGEHNVANALAAVLACRLVATCPAAALAAGLRAFRPLDHRLQRVGEIGGVAFYNDSKATNLDAALRALESFRPGTVHLILGGKDKGGDWDAMVGPVRRFARRVLLVGEAAPAIAAALPDDVEAIDCGTRPAESIFARRWRRASRAGEAGMVGKRLVFDPWLFFTAALLVLLGLFMVGSASHYVAMREDLSPHHFLLRQGIHAALGMIAMLVLMNVDYRLYREKKYVLPAVGACAVLLLVVLALPPIAGVHRWIPLGPVRVQPSEITKLVAILFMASMLSRREDRVNDFQSVHLPCLLALGSLAFLIVIGPDLGSAAILAGTAFVMIFAAGLRWRYVFGLTGMGLAALALGIAIQPYRWERIQSYLNLGADLMGRDWQLTQSLVALGRGGLIGAGFGRGHQQALFLPQAHTDFIYSVIGEEFGFVGCTLVLAAFLILGWRGLRAAGRAPDSHGFYVALGITAVLVFQALVHMGVCVGLFQGADPAVRELRRVVAGRDHGGDRRAAERIAARNVTWRRDLRGSSSPAGEPEDTCSPPWRWRRR